jgi:hypothetical protein
MPLVTPKRVRAVYALLQHVPPFERWSLPPVGNIKFEILHGPDTGEYSVDWNDRATIAVNADTNLSLAQMVETVAHEMVHLRQDQLGRLPEVRTEKHNAEFRRLARLVCRDLGFDVQRF